MKEIVDEEFCCVFLGVLKLDWKGVTDLKVKGGWRFNNKIFNCHNKLSIMRIENWAKYQNRQELDGNHVFDVVLFFHV